MNKERKNNIRDADREVPLKENPKRADSKRTEEPTAAGTGGENQSFLTKFYEIGKGIGMDKLLIIAICGVVLVILSMPSSNNKSKTNKKEPQTTADRVSEISVSSSEYAAMLERKLELFLINADGIGNVKVMITLEDYGEKVVLAQKPYSKNEQKDTDSQGGTSTRTEYSQEEQVVYEKDSQGNEIPYIVKNRQPTIKGIAVIAQGGNDAKTVVKITNLIEALFGVSDHKISVIGMSK